MKVVSIGNHINKRISARGSKRNFKGYKVRMITSRDPRSVHLAQKMYASALEIRDDDPKAAMDWYRKAIELKPDFFEAMLNLSAILIDSHTPKNYEEAEEILKRLLEIRPDYVSANYNLASLYQDTRQYKDAEKFYLEALRYDTSHADSYFNLGKVYSFMGCHKKSKGCFENYLEFDSSSSYAVEAKREIGRMDAVLSMGKDNLLQVVKRPTD